MPTPSELVSLLVFWFIYLGFQDKIFLLDV